MACGHVITNVKWMLEPMFDDTLRNRAKQYLLYIRCSRCSITNNRINAAAMVHSVGEPQRTAPENSGAFICPEDLLIHLLELPGIQTADNTQISPKFL